MSLDLDARQRAMLAEMQVPVWWPETAVEPAVAPPAVQSIAQAIASAPELVAASEAAVSARALKDAEALAAAPARSDGSDLRAAWTACQAWVALNTAPHAPADWLVLGESLGLTDADPLATPEAQLLANMLRAVGIIPTTGQRTPDARSACITSLQKTADSGPFLQRQVALLQPKVILALGPFAAQLLLQDSLPLGQLRGRVHRYQGVPVVVSYHPATLLRNPPAKAKAWADLVLALGALDVA
jgi:DNA polymerase